MGRSAQSGYANLSPFQFLNGLLNVVAIKRNSVRRLLGRMAAHFRLRQIEDQPAIVHVGVGKTELVANERTAFLGLGCIKHRVHTLNHKRLQ